MILMIPWHHFCYDFLFNFILFHRRDLHGIGYHGCLERSLSTRAELFSGERCVIRPHVEPLTSVSKIASWQVAITLRCAYVISLNECASVACTYFTKKHTQNAVNGSSYTPLTGGHSVEGLIPPACARTCSLIRVLVLSWPDTCFSEEKPCNATDPSQAWMRW